MDCVLKYIPEHLHTIENPIVKKFSIGEQLHYRCKTGECEKPYDKISLYDISHNRDFGDSEKYLKEDVLYNIDENDENEKYPNTSIATLIVSELTNEITYEKEIISRQNPLIKSYIRLKHSPVACMYPHSVFEISVNEIIINSSNYKKTLGKSNVTYKNLRSDIRQELTSIIQTGSINDSEDIEIIAEP